MPEVDPEIPNPQKYPTITIADLHVVKTVLDQVIKGGSGAQDRAAKIISIILQ